MLRFLPIDLSGRPWLTRFLQYLLLNLMLLGFLSSIPDSLSLCYSQVPIDLTNQRELFVDRFLIESLETLTLKLHEPKATEPMSQPANDMEYGTIIRDGSVFRMYTREGRGAKFDGDDKEVTRYCESNDGIHWTRPNLGLIKLDGSKDNNVILKEAPYCHNFAPFLDENPKVDRKSRFKALAGTVKSGLVAFESEDGIHWSKIQSEPVIQYTKEYAFDSQNVAFWSLHEGMYVCYFRHFLDGKLRSICRTTSHDFVHWTEPIAMRPNLPDEHLYTSLTHPYFRAPHLYIATPTRFFPNANNRTDILLMTARGDKPFDRTFRQAWIRPGLESQRWENRANYAAWHIVQTGPEEMSLYTTPFRRFTLRLDGFASVHAQADKGLMTTKVFTINADRLSINASTSAAGSIRVELTKPDGTPIEGFRFQDCQEFVGDSIDASIQWNPKSDLRTLAGQPIRARFEMTDADLYAIEFQAIDRRRVDFNESIRPVFQQRCFACHGTLKQESGLRLDTAASILKGSESGQVVRANDAPNSSLIQRITARNTDERMPPEGHALEESQVQTIADWINQGAAIPENDHPEDDPISHWAFQSPTRPALPTLNAPGQGTPATIHPIDAFLENAWKSHRVSPQSLADPSTRLRRVYLNLIGLPPSQQAIASFTEDPSQAAYERIVDDLLASPEYGQRWARHWMDVWRYADWFGRRYVPDVWNSAPQIWRWRDWIVESLNDDTGYDQMIREMLAADELKPGDPKTTVATGYLVRNWYALNPNDWMRSNVEHTSKAFLGLTFHCAHCHDHKYDPISQENYFQLRAFFEPIYVRQDRLAGQADPGKFQDYEYSTLRKVQRLGRVSVYDKTPDATTWFYSGGDERNRQTDRPTVAPNVPDFLKTAFEQIIEPVELPPHAWYPGLDPQIIETMIQQVDQQIDQANQELIAAQSSHHSASQTEQAQSNQKHQVERILQLQKQLDDLDADKGDHQAIALSGLQSLLLDASSGRRMIYRSMPEIPGVAEGDQIQFLVRVLADTHFNFQLTRNNATGATATYVGFEKGTIKSYKPASFEEFAAGKFNPESGESFLVQLTLHPSLDQCTLNIQARESGTKLVDGVKIALNGWNPVGDPTKGILFDARPGSVAALDDWRYLSAPQPDTLNTQVRIAFDFEENSIKDGTELVGSLNWTDAKDYSIAPASSKVVRNLPSLEFKKIRHELEVAQRARDRLGLSVEIAKSKLSSLQASRQGILSRVQAEKAKYIPEEQPRGTTLEELVKKASLDEKTEACQARRLERLTATSQLAEAESKSPEDPNRPKEIETASGKLAKAEAELSSAQTALENATKADASAASYAPLSPQYPKTSTGRRKALAAWITSTKNPLTARVGVNHIWMRHFHQPLVQTVFDFGRNGAKPTHPELLDWLAVEWMESGWSIKHLHRLIVTSQAYQRQSSSLGNPSQEIDPENRWYWRMNSGRMEVEVLRDSILKIAGKLDSSIGGQELENKDIFTTWRRTLYYSCQPEEDGKSPLGMLFDGPDASDCYRRTRTVIPQQSLALTNSPLVHDLAPLIVQQVEDQLTQQDRGLAEPFINSVYLSILNRRPSSQEQEISVEYLRESTDSRKQRESLVRVLLNHSSFITIR